MQKGDELCSQLSKSQTGCGFMYPSESRSDGVGMTVNCCSKVGGGLSVFYLTLLKVYVMLRGRGGQKEKGGFSMYNLDYEVMEVCAMEVRQSKSREEKQPTPMLCLMWAGQLMH